MLTTQALLPQYLVCSQFAHLVLGLTGLKTGPKRNQILQGGFSDASKKETGKESCQEEKEVATERSQVSVISRENSYDGCSIEHPFLLLSPGQRFVARLKQLTPPLPAK